MFLSIQLTVGEKRRKECSVSTTPHYSVSRPIPKCRTGALCRLLYCRIYARTCIQPPRRYGGAFKRGGASVPLPRLSPSSFACSTVYGAWSGSLSLLPVPPVHPLESFALVQVVSRPTSRQSARDPRRVVSRPRAQPASCVCECVRVCCSFSRRVFAPRNLN